MIFERPDLDQAARFLSVGYLWVSALLGANQARELAFWSSRRDIVEILRLSSSVRAFFRSLALFADPPEVRVVDEWQSVSRL
ncbi:MAG: hypothetical protein EPN60_12130 [Nevskiaceae bacterium]|nr:MAG: hypothetical protein EPO48_03645 [Nevskiaceae bacterium]TAM25422.1 MAG: hypothetical protein EPN60_12130 [Nevskiaceae bacterium]